MSPPRAAILVADRSPSPIADELSAFDVSCAASLSRAVLLLGRPLAAVVAARDLGGEDGLDLLERAARLRPEAVRVLVGPHVDDTVERAIRAGIVTWMIEAPWVSGEVERAVRPRSVPTGEPR